MSLHAIGSALAAYLATQGCPLTVVYGPELPTTTFGRERIVLEHAVGAKDSFGAPRGLHVNAKHRHTVTDNYKLTIYVRSAASGAKPFEHRERARAVREVVVAGLDYVAATRKNRWSPQSGSLITPPDLAATELPGGAVYELLFTYETPIRVVTFANAARPEGDIGAITSTTEVAITGALESDPHETACGA